MVNSPRLGIRLMASNDLQKEVIFNEAVVALDSMTARTAKNRTNNPPGSPVNGDTYIVGTAGTGAWSGHDNEIAVYFSGWRFYTPASKMKFFNETSASFWTYTAGAWTQDAAGTPTTLDDLANVGGAAPEDGQVLTFDSDTSMWRPETLPSQLGLSQLPDVDVSSGVADGQVLAWDESEEKWVPVTPSGGGGGASSLAELTDIQWGGAPGDGYVLRWSSGAGKAQFVEFETSIQLDDLTDVDVSGASANDVLAFNGSGWGPSPAVITYSFLGMVDGPGTFDGYANHFLVVDPTESFMQFRSLQDLIDDLDDFRMQDLTDVAVPSDAAVGRVVTVAKTGANFHYAYTQLIDYSISFWKDEDETALTAKVTKFTFKGFNVTEPNEGEIVVEALNALAFSEHGNDIEGPITELNFAGALTAVEEDGVLTIGLEVPEPVVELGGLTDVDLETTPPVDGNTLVYDGVSQTWVPGLAAGGGGGMIDGEAKPALYEFGPFAPPEADFFPNHTFAPSADMDDVEMRGLVFSGGPSASGVKHAFKWRNLVNNEEPWVVTCRVVPNGFDVNGFAAGIALGRAFNNRFVALCAGQAEDANHPQVYSSWVTGDTNVATLIKQEPNLYNWLRLAFDGNFIRAYVSADGLIFSPYGAEIDPATTLLGVPDRVGIVVRTNEVSDGQGTGLFTYYDDPDFPAITRIQQGVVSLAVSGLTDVDFSTPPLNGQTIVWHEESSTWRAGDAGGGGSLAELEDVDLTTTPPEEGQALVWDGTNWVPGPASPETLGDIGDVDMTTPPEDGQALIWDETAGKWVPGAGVPEELGDIGDVDLTVAAVNGNSLVFDGASGKWKAGVGLGNVAADFDLSFFIPGTPDADMLASYYLTAREFTLEVDLEDSFAYASTPPGSDIEFSLRKNGVAIGTLDFAFGTNVGVFTFPTDVPFDPGDRLEIWSPAGLGGIEDIAITIAGTRA